MKQKNIRNFAIIAHIDHGKSTLSDRIMEMTKTINKREASDQLLDSMQVEQKHNVTVKARSVRNIYQAKNGQKYEFNLIDTPGHVDFSYEVSKSLSASDGVILLVDATKGVQAQTVANFKLAKKLNLPIIPVINKIDTQAAQIEKTTQEILALDPRFKDETIYKVSAKSGKNVDELLEAIVNKIPAPTGNNSHSLKAIIFDSEYNSYKGIIAHIRIVDGQIEKNQNLKLMAKNEKITNAKIGIFTPNMQETDLLTSGEVGYVVTGFKDPEKVRVGDTITNLEKPASKPLPGYQPAKSMVFAGIYPKNSDYKDLKNAIEKLALNDPSFHYKEEVSEALGSGFRCGFLGEFHLQIIRERLKDEYKLDVLVTAPNVSYKVFLKQENGQLIEKEVNNPVDFPSFEKIAYVKEPYMKIKITTPSQSVSAIMKLVEQNMGELLDMGNEEDLVKLFYKVPLFKVANGFFNELKSVSHGYANLDMKFLDYETNDLVKVEVDVNYSNVDALSFIIHRQDVAEMTQELVHKLKYTMPKKLYPTPVQAIVEGKAVARIDVPPLRKNAAVSGEKQSISKKQALLRRQSLNKRRAAHEKIELPQEVFNVLLEI
ncbi:translation elongation factor 4 [Lactobacillus sp. PSON]|uniref:translation elongation factor 4 n=1 Tax=Lactobacillus sp. PSON TaxID=3455454 RepID=UPI004041FD1B